MTDDEAADRLARFFFRLAKWLISGVFVVVFLFLRYLFTHHPKIFWALLGVVGVVAVFYFGIYTLSQTNSVPVQTLPASAQVTQQPTHASAPTDAQMTQPPSKTTIRPTQTTIPRRQAIIIDDNDSEFVVEGLASGWRIASYGYNGSTHWTYCTDAGISNWAKWIPHLPLSGNYEVYVHVPEHNAGTKQATYRIFHNQQVDEVVVRQSDYANVWVSLGICFFGATGSEYIYLDDNTGEPRSQAITIGFDAVKFEYVP